MKGGTSGDATATPGGIGPYWERSRRPLQILVFLLPLVAVYEVGVVASVRMGITPPSLLAYRKVEEAFDAMGLAMAGQALPAILVVAALLAWQALSKRPWRIHWPTTAVMAVESVVLAVPLILLASVLVTGASPPTASLLLADVAVSSPAVDAPGLGSRLLMSIGAGLYEEFLFRWILIAVLHAILVDGLRIADRTATGVAIVASSLLFMLAHQPSDAGHALFYLAGGAFFSVIYVLREFGIAAGTHAAYDVLVELLGSAV